MINTALDLILIIVLAPQALLVVGFVTLLIIETVREQIRNITHPARGDR